MIDPLTEEVIYPNAAIKLYPRGADGRTPHVSRIYRDMKRGCGGVVLESVRTPKLATSREAVARFFRRLTEAAEPAGTKPMPARPRSTRDVEHELDRLGL